MTNPLLAQFLAEADELLTVLDDGLLSLEQDPHNAELVNDVFRAAHTIKGSSGLFDFPELTRLVHAAEDLLDAVRGGRIALDPALTDDLLATADLVRSWLSQVGDAERLPATAGSEGAALIARLRAPLDGGVATADAQGGGVARPAVAPGPGVPTADAPSWLALLGATWLEATGAWLSLTGATVRCVRYLPDEGCYFQGEDPVHLVSQVPGLERVVPVQPDSWLPAHQYEEYTNLLGYVLATRAGVGELSYLFRYVSEQVEMVDLDGAAVRRLLDASLGRTVVPCDDPEAPAGARQAHSEAEQGIRDDACIVLRAALRSLAVVDAVDAVPVVPGELAETDGDPSSSGRHSARTGSTIRTVVAAARALGLDVDLGADAAVDQVAAVIVGLLAEHVVTPSGSEGPTVDATPADSDGPAVRLLSPPQPGIGDPQVSDQGGQGGHLGSRTLRVDQDKVDRMMELVGELHVAKNAMAFLGDAAEEEFGSRLLSRRIKDQYAVQHRLVAELQSAVMDIRMLPLSVAFARFTRLVRDLGRRLDKSVELVTDGGDTMADKDVIEALGDPLMHLVRNCVDHGLESAVERGAAGKSAHGTVRLSAFSDGDAVVVEVTDDGRGIDPDQMRLAAYGKGLITEDELGSLSDTDAVNLVFRPGFSTASEVSDVSGRGVGMDAVRASVEKLGGTVAMRSQPGVGTVATLRMPLTMTVTRVLVVSVAGQRFGVPIEAVVETVRVPADDVARVLRQDVVVLRGEVVPLVDLAETLQMTAAGHRSGPSGAGAGESQEQCVLVIRVAGQRLGLRVDRFHREVEVLLKPMEGMLTDHPVLAGTALLGDGLVLLVLNPKEVLGHVAPAA